MVWATYKNAPWSATATAGLATFHWTETLGQTQDLVERLYLALGLGMLEAK